MMSSRYLACALTLAALAGTPRVAVAQTSPATPTAAAPSAEATKRAEASYKQGVRLYSEKKFAEAEAAFEAAWAVNPTADVAYNLGTAEYQQGKYQEAAEHLSFALRAWPLLSVMAPLRPIAEQRMAESRTFVGALTVKVNQEQAEVFVDGRAVGRAPLAGEVFVAPGAHVVEAKLKGYVGAKEAVQIEKGAAKTVELKLAAITPMEAASGESGDSVKPKGASASGTESAAGDSGLRKKLIIAGIASSAVAITGGVVFAIVASVKASDADDQQTALFQDGGGRACEMPTTLADRCSELESSLGAERTFSNLSLWTFVTGGLVGAGTAIYALTTPTPKPKGAVQVVPMVAAQGGGVFVMGRW
jgi:hypothetical protein